jgi:two-component system chemotaxis sensor kinase CheA
VDTLADLVGELVVAKNALAHLAAKAGDKAPGGEWAKDLLANQAAIDRLVNDMHQAVTQIRMLPMRDTFQRFPRAVRDAASQQGKGVDFVMEGEDVEADKSIVEGLFEPLLHVIRNAVAHGAEPEHIRRESGKPARVRITLRAHRAGDLVLVEVEDDGRGIDPAKVRQAALDRGLISREAADRMPDAEAIDLIFAPGFSTATEVTDLSGRGVGMDAVRAGVERLGGRVSLRSTPGHGTSVRLSLPLTVVMTKVMTVRAGRELYGVPIDSVAETTIVPAERILPIGDAEAFVLRDRTIPLLRLGRLLDIPVANPEASNIKVVVMQVESGMIGLAVDGFAERMDVPLRPMTGILSGMPGIAGTTLLGDGSVLMVLDIQELIG